MKHMKNRIVLFAALVEEQQMQRLTDQGFTLEVHRRNYETSIRAGRKFANIMIGDSSRFMVDMETGNIFGTKGFGQVHRGHFYGTVDTMDQWNWGDYYPQRIANPIPDQGPRTPIPQLTFAPTPAVGGPAPRKDFGDSRPLDKHQKTDNIPP